MAHNGIDLKENNKEKVEKITIENYRSRKVLVVWDFPPGCGRGAAPVSKEDYVNEQQGQNDLDEEDP
ncbi:Uncharacterized protein TCM_018350 [Theobroma cacao]|uniref:Uncharacterized protein n=1 Tax=Theobroma cacao TaxID=3641 RepID=A0A061EEJ5_THECC|nr:Uncharacterized protein TCM_018350 [Theobroma cacao]